MYTFYVDVKSGELILVTNEKEKEFFGSIVSIPMEGLVFVFFENKMITWSLQNIEGRNLVELPDDLARVFMRQFRELMANLSKNS